MVGTVEPGFQAVEAISRCAQGTPLTKRWMNSAAVMASRCFLAVALRCCGSTLKRGAVETWISPAIAITWVRSSTSTSDSSNYGSANATALAYLTAYAEVKRNVLRGGVLRSPRRCRSSRTSVPSSVST